MLGISVNSPACSMDRSDLEGTQVRVSTGAVVQNPQRTFNLHDWNKVLVRSCRTKLPDLTLGDQDIKIHSKALKISSFWPK